MVTVGKIYTICLFAVPYAMSRPNRRQVLGTVGSALTIGLAGCPQGVGGGDETPTPTVEPTPTPTATPEGMSTPDGTTGNVRVAHYSPDAPDVDVYVDGDQVLSGVPFRAVSDYMEVPTGSRTVEITAAGDPDTVAFSGDIDVAEGDFTIAAVGELTDGDTEFRPLVLEDDNSDVADDTARVRLVHASPDAPAVDVTVASSGDALYDGVSFGQSGYVEVPEGTYTLQVRGDTSGNDGDVVAEFTVELAGGTVYTGFAGGYLTADDEPADEPFDLSLAVDSGAGGGGLVDRANVRVAHFSPDAPNVDVYVDDDQVLSDVPFRTTSDYLSVPAGTRTVQITAAGDRSTVAFEGDLALSAQDYTVAAIGELTDGDTEFRPLVLEDDNSDVAGDTARVRLVHASPDAPAVDVTVASSGDALYDGVPFGESGYVEVPEGTYTLQVRGDTSGNDGDVVADFNVELAGGTVYTAFAGGYLTPGDEPADEAFDLSLAVDSGAGGGGKRANVRVAHFSPDAPNVDVYVDDDRVLSDVPFRATSDYLSVPAGSRSVEITAAGDRSTVAFAGDVEVGASDYTVAAVGELTDGDTEFRPLVLEDDNSPVDGDTARVRLVHASPDAPAVDVTLESSGDALYDSVPFGESGYVEVPEGTYTLQVRGDTSGNDGDVVAQFPIEFAGGTVYTAFAGGYLTPGDEPADEAFDLSLAVDSGAGGGGKRANVRVAHFSPDAPNVDVYVDDDRVLSDVPFRTTSDYLSVPAGSRSVEITAAGDPDTVAFEGDVDVGAGDYTVAAVGELTDGDTEFQPLVLEDDNTPVEDARVRLVHVSPDAPAVDVTVRDSGDALYDDVAYTESAYTEVPQGAYSLQVRGATDDNDGAIVAEFDHVSVFSGTVYTVFAGGYLTPDDEPADESFDLTVETDAEF